MTQPGSGSLTHINVADIVLREGVIKRSVNSNAVDQLVDSIKDVGMTNPIRVRKSKRYESNILIDAWQLIAGRHRVEAAKKLGWETIAANVDDLDDDHAEMAMIDENLRRADLTPSEYSYAVDRRKDLYEKMHPETRNGGDRGNQHTGGKTASLQNLQSADRFTKATAAVSGKSERGVQAAAAIGKALGDDLLKTAGTSLDKAVELQALAKMSEPDRKAIVERAAAGEKVSARPAKTLREERKQAEAVIAAQAEPTADDSIEKVAKAKAAHDALTPDERNTLYAMIGVEPIT